MGMPINLDRASNVADGVALLVLQEDIVVACNQSALTLFQCERRDLLGRSFLDFSVAVQANGRNSADALRLRTAAALADQPQKFTWICKRTDDETFKTEATLDRIRARGKTYVKLSLDLVSKHDPTGEALLKFRLGIERIDDAVFITDVDGHIIYANPAFERIYGFTVEEALGNTPRILKSGVMPREVYEEFWSRLLNKQIVAGEIINKTKDGRLINVEGSNNPIVDDSDNLVGFLSIHRDITARKRSEETLQHAQEQLEKRVEERTAELERVNKLLKSQFSELEFIKEAFERRNLILEALNELARQTSSSLELEPIFNRVIEITGQLLDCTSAYVSTLDLERGTATVAAEYFSSEASSAEKVSDLGTTYKLQDEFGKTPSTLLEGGEIRIIHFDDPTTTPEERAHMRRFGVMSILEVILLVEGEPVAEIAFWESRHKREFDDEEMELVRAVARQVAVPIQNARLYQQAKREINERELLEQQINLSYERRGRHVQLSTQLTNYIVAATDLADLYQRVVSQIKQQFGYYHVQLLRFEPSLDAVVLTAGYGEIGEKMLAAEHKIPMGSGLIGTAAATGKSVLRSSIEEDPNWQSNPLLPETEGELAVPIMLGTEVLGVLDVQSNAAGKLDADDQLALEGLCGQIAIAIESTRLRQEMEDRLLELNELQRIMSREGWDAYRTHQDSDTKAYRYDRASVKDVSSTSSTTQDLVERFWDNQLLTEPKPVVETPMTVRGEIIGALGIRDDPDSPMSAEDKELLDSISEQVAEALESARLLEQTQKHALEMEAVARVSAAASSILDSRRLLHTVTQLTKERFGLHYVAIFTLAGQTLRKSSGTLPASELATRGMPAEVHLLEEQSLVASAARTREPVVVNNFSEYFDHHPKLTLSSTRAELAMPLIAGDQLLGVFDLQSDVENSFGEDEVRIHATLAAQVAVALQNAILYAEQLETTERLREVDRLKSEFLASMSHELRTPLNSIIGFADVLLEGIDGDLNERMVEDVTLIRDSGRHLRSLISEMLDMSKIEAGVMELYYEEIDVPTLAEEIIANAQSLAKDKEIVFELQVDPGLKTIEADRTRLTQVLLNLMSNAIKFTEKGEITLSLSQNNGELVASVQDTGMGIEQEDIPKIFEQFRQVDGSPTRKAGGTGLGIPISRSLVELHGGKMWVESDPGVGSTFSFTIPAQKIIKSG
jgi:PAS domain S-box-containing protein